MMERRINGQEKLLLLPSLEINDREANKWLGKAFSPP